MAYIITLTDLVAPPRFDNVAFIKARVEQASDEAGPWTLLQELLLDPRDPDPSNPLARSFTIRGATSESGWYRIIYIDEDSDTQELPPFFLNAYYDVWVPTRYDVGALLRSRTVSAGGGETGTFNDKTRPTGEQCDRTINIAIGDVTEVIGSSPPEQVWSVVRSAVALRAAMLIELSYFPEQAESGRSPYKSYKELYAEKINNVMKAVKQQASGGQFGSIDDGQLPKYGGFPTHGIGMEMNW